MKYPRVIFSNVQELANIYDYLPEFLYVIPPSQMGNGHLP